MEIRASSMLRWSRASLLGLVMLATGLTAHLSAAGLLPGPGQLIALYLIVVLGCAAFLGREASTWRLTALMVGGQAFVHTGLAALAGHHGDADAVHEHLDVAGQQASIVPWNARSGQSYSAWAQQNLAHAHSSEIVLPGWMAHAITDLTAHPLMTLAHVVAAIAVGAWLAIGERALWAVLKIASTGALHLARTLRFRLGGLNTILLARIHRIPSPDTHLEPPPQLTVWSRGPTRRGPPQALLAR